MDLVDLVMLLRQCIPYIPFFFIIFHRTKNVVSLNCTAVYLHKTLQFLCLSHSKPLNEEIWMMKRNSVHFFVAISTLSLFILCLSFLEGEKKRERKSNGDKKNAWSSVSSFWILYYTACKNNNAASKM